MPDYGGNRARPSSRKPEARYHAGPIFPLFRSPYMHRALALLLALTVFPAQAEVDLLWGDTPKQFEYDFDENAKPWKELQSQMPPYPKSGNLVEIPVGGSSSNRFFVDPVSLSAGEDGVVRYGIVIKSPAGAQTVNYEGMRCATGERKIYAFGRSDPQTAGEWSRNRYAKWEPIQGRSHNDYRRILFHYYFCNVDGPAQLPFIQRMLKSGGQFSRE